MRSFAVSLWLTLQFYYRLTNDSRALLPVSDELQNARLTKLRSRIAERRGASAIYGMSPAVWLILALKDQSAAVNLSLRHSVVPASSAIRWSSFPRTHP